MPVLEGPAPLQGKVAIVTGSASGIGRASAQAFAGAGAKVVVADIDATGGEETARLIRAAGGDAAHITVDVTDEASVRRLVRTFVLPGLLEVQHIR